MKTLLIICPPEFSELCENYANFKRKMGITCQAVNFSENDAMKAFAALTALSLKVDVDPAKLASEPCSMLKLIIAMHYLSYDTRYVLLAGDIDKIPVPFYKVDPYFYPTDLYYADLFSLKPGQDKTFETWDKDRDYIKGGITTDQISPINFYPDVAVGRIPASSTSELSNALTRLMNRKAQTPKCLVLRGNDPKYPASTEWLENVATDAYDRLKKLGYEVCKLSIEPNADKNTSDNILKELKDRLSKGVDYIFWFGHGGRNCWGYFGPHTINFPNEVPNISGSPVVFSMSCDVGTYVDGVMEAGAKYYSGGILTSPKLVGSTLVAPVPDSLQPPPSTLEHDFGPEQWLVKSSKGASCLIAGHSWASMNTSQMETQPLDFIDSLKGSRNLTLIGNAYNNMMIKYLQRYRKDLSTDLSLLNHLLRMNLFGDPTTPIFY